ncbi:hypothetical protein [Vibrio mediterranei]
MKRLLSDNDVVLDLETTGLDYDGYEFAGRCCDTYGNPGFLFSPRV